MDEEAFKTLVAEAIALERASFVATMLELQGLLTLSLAYIPPQDRDLRAQIVAALAIRPNG